MQLDAATVLAGGNEAAGQDLAALAAVFDRIYVETTAEQLPALTAALEPYDAELVPILSEAPASGSYLLTAWKIKRNGKRCLPFRFLVSLRPQRSLRPP